MDVSAYNATLFDIETQSQTIQMLKTIVPYLDNSKQLPMVFLIKYMELQHTIKYLNKETSSMTICAATDSTERMYQLINDIKKFLTPSEQDTVDMIITTLQMLSL